MTILTFVLIFSIHKVKENYKENEIKNGMGNVNDHPDSSSGYPGNLLLSLNSWQSEMV